MTEYERFDKEDMKADEMESVVVSLFEDIVRFKASDDNAYRQRQLFCISKSIEQLEHYAEEIAKIQNGE